MKLSKNFTLEELTKSITALRHGIKNIPNAEETSYLTQLCQNVLQPIREAYGLPIVVSSGFRCKQLNKIVKGATNSDHVYGCAADIHTVSDKPSDNKKLFDLIIKLKNEGKIKCRQIINEYNYNWIHVSINNRFNSYKVNQVLHIK